jgi:hypothetical protein
MFLSAETLTLDFIHFSKDSRLVLKQFQYRIIQLILVPFVLCIVVYPGEPIGMVQYFLEGSFNNFTLVLGFLFNFVWRSLSVGEILNTFVSSDLPYFWLPAIIIIYIESKFIKNKAPLDVRGQEAGRYYAYRILLRDRIFALGAYYYYAPMFYFHMSQICTRYPVLRTSKIPFNYFFTQASDFVTTHYKVPMLLEERYFLLMPMLSIVLYLQVVRRHNGWDTVWVNQLTRHYWQRLHTRKPYVPPGFKHFVRHNWSNAWLLFAATLVSRQVTEGIIYFITGYDTANVVFFSFMAPLYYGGSFFFITGAISALLGLRAWNPFLFTAILNQTMPFMPPEKPQRNVPEDFEDFIGDYDDPYSKFRF